MQTKIHKDVVLSLLTTAAMDGDMLALDECAVSDFLRAIRAAGHRSERLQVFDDGSIEVDGEPIEIQAQTADIIRLIYQRGRISRSAIAQSIWGCHDTANKVQVAISKAKSLLEKHDLTILYLPSELLQISDIS